MQGITHIYRKGLRSTILFILPIILTSCTSKNSKELCPDMPEGYLLPGCYSGYAKNIALIYISDFAGNVMNWSAEEFLPYLAYIDENHQSHPELMLFDTFLFLSGARNVNGELHSFANKYETGEPSNIDDWNWLLKMLFDEKDYGLNALQDLAGIIGRKLKVIIIIPYPDREQHNAGIINSNVLDFGVLDDRKLAVINWIDTVISKWKEKSYSNLELIGFYWMNEVMTEFFGMYGNNLDEILTSTLRDYLHSIKVNGTWMRFFWIPSNLRLVVEDLGADNSPWYTDSTGNKIFDTVIFQPNYMQGFYEWRSYKTLEDVAKVAYENGFGVEMEFNECIYFDNGCLTRCIEYFNAGEKYGFNTSVQAFVFGNTQLSKMANEIHWLYEKIYNYMNK